MSIRTLEPEEGLLCSVVWADLATIFEPEGDDDGQNYFYIMLHHNEPYIVPIGKIRNYGFRDVIMKFIVDLQMPIL